MDDSRPRLYLDTSVYGGCFDPEFEVASKQVLDLIRTGRAVALVSAVVAQEIAAAPPRVQEVYRSLPDENVDETFFDAKARSLFVGYVRAGFVTPRVANDAFHVATATAAGAFAIVSWNFRDIVHPDKMRWYNGINVALGFPALKIVSPREVIRLVE